jgi:tetratricopeptide (TPR) repeat protein
MANFPFKAVSKLSLLCSSLILSSLSSAPIPSKDAQFLKRMKEYWKEGDYDLAKRQIRSYLEENPSCGLGEELHLLLGDLYLKDGNFESALEEYNLITKESLRDKTLYNKVLCLYETGKTQELADISGTFASSEALNLEQKNSIRYLCAYALFEYLGSQEEKDSDITKRTKELFEDCKGTSFENLSFYPLAKLYESEGQKKEAASYYEAASRAHPDQKADLLFQAALLRSEVAPELAIAGFEEIVSLDSPKQSSALYNCLLLHYKLSEFSELVAMYERHQSLIDPSLHVSVANLVGKSLYHLKQFEKATPFLLESLSANLPEDSERTTQLMVLECAHKTGNVELYESTFRSRKSSLAADENYPQAHLVYLDLLKTKEKHLEFIEESKNFILQNPRHIERERVLWEVAYHLYQSKNWKEADGFFETLVQDYPDSTYAVNAWRLSLNCSLSTLSESSPEDLPLKRAALITKIQKVLEQPNLLSSIEKETFSFEIVKNLFLMDRFEETLKAIPAVSAINPQSRFLQEMELIQTLCYLSNPNQRDLFIEDAERLLKTRSYVPEADKIRLHLFNAYVQKAGELSEDKQPHLFDLAAKHLYVVFESRHTPIKKENLEWLSEHYYALAKHLESEDSALAIKEECQVRAISLLEFLLAADEAPLKEESELQLMRLSDLLTLTGQPEKKAAFLSRFLDPKALVQTPIQKQLLLELAKTYQTLGEAPKALDLYAHLIENYPFSKVRAQAILNRSQLLFTYLPEDQKTEENTIFLTNLNDLKDLEAQRSLVSEPLHLEAGLEYIKWKAFLVKDVKAQKEKTIHLLRLFKENFEAEEMPKEMDEPAVAGKKQILVSYLTFVDAEILRLESSLSESEEDAKALSAKAATRLQELCQWSSLPQELKSRINLTH